MKNTIEKALEKQKAQSKSEPNENAALDTREKVETPDTAPQQMDDNHNRLSGVLYLLHYISFISSTHNKHYIDFIRIL